VKIHIAPPREELVEEKPKRKACLFHGFRSGFSPVSSRAVRYHFRSLLKGMSSEEQTPAKLTGSRNDKKTKNTGGGYVLFDPGALSYERYNK